MMQRRKQRDENGSELTGAVAMAELPASALVNEESDSESESQSLKPLGGEAALPANAASRNMQILWRQFKGFPPAKELAVPPNERRFVPICNPKNLLRKFGFHPDSVGLGSLDGAIVYDRNTASVPGFHLPLVLDMVRDSVKNRLLNVLGFACIFCSVILILASFIFVAPLDAIPNKVC